MPKSRTADHTITVRLSEQEFRELYQNAHDAHQSVNSYIRTMLQVTTHGIPPHDVTLPPILTPVKT